MDLTRFAGITVLVVDENRFMRSLVRQLFNAVGIRNVVEAGDSAVALEELRRLPVDLVVCELELNPIDGVEFIRMIRTAPDMPNPFVPVIVLTGEARLAKVLAARDAGMSEFMAKPLTAKAFYGRILAVFEKPRPFVRTTGYFGPDRRRRETAVSRNRRSNRPSLISINPLGVSR